MINFIKNKLGPQNCDDDKLMKRMKRAWKVNSWTNFYACCGSWSLMGVVPAGVAMFLGLPGIVPLALLGGGITVLASAIPAVNLTDKIENAFNAEARKRGLWKREWDEDYCPPCPYEEEFNRRMAEEHAKKSPVLAEIFDPSAAVILGDSIRAMPSIKLKARPHDLG